MRGEKPALIAPPPLPPMLSRPLRLCGESLMLKRPAMGPLVLRRPDASGCRADGVPRRPLPSDEARRTEEADAAAVAAAAADAAAVAAAMADGRRPPASAELARDARRLRSPSPSPSSSTMATNGDMGDGKAK